MSQENKLARGPLSLRGPYWAEGIVLSFVVYLAALSASGLRDAGVRGMQTLVGATLLLGVARGAARWVAKSSAPDELERSRVRRVFSLLFLILYLSALAATDWSLWTDSRLREQLSGLLLSTLLFGGYPIVAAQERLRAFSVYFAALGGIGALLLAAFHGFRSEAHLPSTTLSLIFWCFGVLALRTSLAPEFAHKRSAAK